MKRWIPDMICGLLILLFVYTATSKLFGYEQFRMQLGSSPWLAPYSRIIAWLVPAVELVIAAMLAFKTLRVYGLYGSLALLSVFTLNIGGMLLSGERLPCSCGGAISQLTWSQHLAFNIFFMALCGLGIVAEHRRRGNMPILSKAGN